MSRQEGYYWVKVSESWFIEYFDGNRWEGSESSGYALSDAYFSEINENRIPAPDEPAFAAWDSCTTYKEGDRLLIDGKEVIVGKTYDMDSLINDGII